MALAARLLLNTVGRDAVKPVCLRRKGCHQCSHLGAILASLLAPRKPRVLRIAYSKFCLTMASWSIARLRVPKSTSRREGAMWPTKAAELCQLVPRGMVLLSEQNMLVPCSAWPCGALLSAAGKSRCCRALPAMASLGNCKLGVRSPSLSA